MKFFYSVLSAACVIASTCPANASRLVSQDGCLQETATISVNFDDMETDLNAIKAKFDAKIKGMEAVGKEVGIEKMDMQSMNYNISPQNYGNSMSLRYQFSGGASYNILPSDKATELMVALQRKGFSPNLSVNAYRNGGNCNMNILE